MTTHDFILVVTGVDHKADDFESRFHDAGCNDATVCYQRGEVLLDFSRDADTLSDAIMTACADIAKAGGVVIELRDP